LVGVALGAPALVGGLGVGEGGALGEAPATTFELVELGVDELQGEQCVAVVAHVRGFVTITPGGSLLHDSTAVFGSTDGSGANGSSTSGGMVVAPGTSWMTTGATVVGAVDSDTGADGSTGAAVVGGDV